MSSVNLSIIKEKMQKEKQNKKKREPSKGIKRCQKGWCLFKINGLSLLALPMLLFAFLAKMLAAALRQFTYILAVGGIILSVVLAFRILQEPQEYIDGAASVIASISLGFIFSLMIIKVLWKFAKRLKKFAGWLQKKMDALFEAFYHRYLKLIRAARKEISHLDSTGNAIEDGFQVGLFKLVRALNQGIAVFVTWIFWIFLVLLLVQILVSLIVMNHRIQAVFGISLQSYIKLFPGYERAYGFFLLVVKKAGILLLLALMAKEWKVWGEELKDSAKEEREENEDAIQGGKIAVLEGILVGDGTEDEVDKANEAQEILNKHLSDFEAFQRKVAETAQKSNNYMLRTKYTEYVAALKDVTDRLAAYDVEIPVVDYAAVSDLVESLDELKGEVEALLDITYTVNQPLPKVTRVQKKEKIKTEQSPGFFNGCDTEEKLDKRFQNLLQIFDADSEAADEKTLAYINQQYKKKKKKYEGAD